MKYGKWNEYEGCWYCGCPHQDDINVRMLDEDNCGMCDYKKPSKPSRDIHTFYVTLHKLVDNLVVQQGWISLGGNGGTVLTDNPISLDLPELILVLQSFQRVRTPELSVEIKSNC